MENRQKQLMELKLYTHEIDKELTMLIQSLQWDRKHLLEGKTLLACKYNTNHKIPSHNRELHEKECFLKSQGYAKADIMLPDPVDADSNTIVKLDKESIIQIINNASRMDPHFNKGVKSQGTEPMTIERLQSTYTADERRAIHDVVVGAVPSCHDLADLALPSVHGGDPKAKSKSRMEILAELRDMKRRRAKYRVAAKTRNYSDVLRDVIKTQMELYNEAQTELTPKTLKTENVTTIINTDNNYKHLNNSHHKHDSYNTSVKTDTENDKRLTHRDIEVSKDSSRNLVRNVDKYEYINKSRESYNSDSKGRYQYNDVVRRSKDKEMDKYTSTSKARSRYYDKTNVKACYCVKGERSDKHKDYSKDKNRNEETHKSRDVYKEKHSDYSNRINREEKYKINYSLKKENESKDDNRKRKKYS